jgi:probable HAF family extracellular repeat protein
MVGIGDLPGGSFYSEANAISADGTVIIGESSSTLCPTYYEAFRWTVSNGMVAMGKLPGGALRSYANSLSADGSVIVGYSGSSNATSGTAEAYRWTAATGMEPLGDFPNGYFNSVAYGVSADGSVVVGRGYPNENGDEEAFRWTAQTGLVHLGFAPGDQSSSAFAVSADGNTIVGAVGNTSPVYALIWRPQWGMRHIQEVLTNDLGLNLTGWTLVSAANVSNDGQVVVGYGTNPSGQTEAWVANLALPSLSISRSGTNILLSWGTNTVGFVLEQTGQLSSGNVWSNVAAQVSILGGQYVVTNGAVNAQSFFRLRKM